MPLNATTYLERHGWRGKGVPLDGERGRGLKKPLAIPMKRNLKGVGKERDRAVEWWDCLFEAGAKKMQTPSSQSSSPKDKAEEMTNSKTLTSSSSLSLATLAKREYARKLLMSGFVRGKPNDVYEEQVKDIEATVALQEQSRLEAKAKLAKELPFTNAKVQNNSESPSISKEEEKRKRKEAKKLKKNEGIKSKKDRKASPNKKVDEDGEDKEERKKRKREEEDTVSSDAVDEERRQKKSKKRTQSENLTDEERQKKEERRKRKKEEKRMKSEDLKSSTSEKAAKKLKSKSKAEKSKKKD